MVREIQAKTLLAPVKPEGWFGIRYNMNLYRGCEHRCIYCDSRSECYGIDRFDDELLVKANALERLEDELPRKRVRGIVGTGSMSDPYTPSERRLNLTGRALELIARHGFGVHLTTKSDLVVRDLEVLKAINRVSASVSFTLTTCDDGLARKVEPGAPPPSARLRALAALSEAGIRVGVTLMPLLPFIEDSLENVLGTVRAAAEAGAGYVVPGFGVTLRDRQRAYYYRKLDQLFPGARALYVRRFGCRYHCHVQDGERLQNAFEALCRQRGLETDLCRLSPTSPATQLSFLE